MVNGGGSRGRNEFYDIVIVKETHSFDKSMKTCVNLVSTMIHTYSK